MIFVIIRILHYFPLSFTVEAWVYPEEKAGIYSIVAFNTINELSSNKRIRNYPNPFSSSTVIEYSNPNNEEVEITIFDITGRTIKTFKENSMQFDPGKITWDGTNENGSSIDTGIYFCQLSAGKYRETIKLILLR